MKIRDLFARPVEREITAVVKINDVAAERMAEELDEYVITPEVEKGLLCILEALAEMYAEGSERFAIWICGPVGCGKSHFVKVLSYLLQNPTGSAARRFLARLAASPRRDEFAAALRELNSLFAAEVIPFQIKAEEDALNRDSISEIMYRRFLAHRGLSRTLWVGTLELGLLRQGGYDAFCRAVAEREGQPWPAVREEALIIRDSVVRALCRALPRRYADEGAASRALDDIQVGLVMGPSRLAAELRACLEQQQKTPRLVYIIDDVGQFVGDDAQKLLELQAIAEQFVAQGKGRLWLVVTSRESLSELLARFGQRRADLAAIVDRFPTRLELASQHVEQVVMERILEKKETARPLIGGLFDRHRQAILNLAAFEDAGDDLPACTADSFARAYPFLPHHFPLLREILAGLRPANNERSVLSIVQALLKSAEAQPGRLVALDELYDLLEAEIPPQERRIVDGVEEAIPPGDGLPLKRILKTLYLLRQTGLVPPTLANLARLLSDDVAADFCAVQAQVKQALDRLLEGRYVTLVGEEYRLSAGQGESYELKGRRIAERKVQYEVLDKRKAATHRQAMALVKAVRDAEEIIPALAEGKVQASLSELERMSEGGRLVEQWDSFVRTAQKLRQSYRAVYEGFHQARYDTYRAIKEEADRLGADTSRIEGYLCDRMAWSRGGVACTTCQQSLLNLHFQVASEDIARREVLRKS
jgi:energy-coupling factor transporter ATP-binding protein EcfA2